jgi:hypothetical protein
VKTLYSSRSSATLEDFSKLDISYNMLSKLEAGSLTDFKFLRVLDLSFNQIRFIHPMALSGDNAFLEYLNLTGNPILSQPCLNPFRKIQVTLPSNRISYPACVQTKILKLTPSKLEIPESYSLLFEILIEAEGLDLSIEKNVARIDGKVCESLRFVVEPSLHTRIGTLACRPSNTKGKNLTFVLEIGNQTDYVKDYLTISENETPKSAPFNITATFVPSLGSVRLSWKYIVLEKQLVSSFRVYQRCSGSTNLSIVSVLLLGDTCISSNLDAIKSCSFSFSSNCVSPQYITMSALISSNEGPISGELGPIYPTCLNSEYLAMNNEKLQKRICLNCPKGGVCNGGNESTVQTMPGYWKIDWVHSEPLFEMCFSELSCKGSNYCECMEGSHGPLCSVCMKNYAFDSKKKMCVPCSSSASSFFLLVGMLASSVILILYILYLTVLDERNSDSKGLDYSAGMVAKVLLSHFQHVSLMKNFGFPWPLPVLNLITGLNFMGSMSDFSYSFTCLAQVSPMLVGDEVFYSRILFALFSPLIVLAFVFPLSVAISKRLRKRIDTDDKQLDNWNPLDFRLNNMPVKTWRIVIMKISLIISAVILHPALIENTMKLFSCIQIFDRRFLVENLNINCLSDSHRIFSYSIGIPSILIIWIGIPCFLFYQVYRLNSISDSQDMKRLTYSYLTRSFRMQVPVWESVLMIRKMGIAFLSIVLSTSSLQVQVFWGMLWLTFFLSFHSILQPFKSPLINHLESTSLGISIATFACGLYFGIGKELHDVEENQTLSAFIIITNLLFIFYSVFLLIFSKQFSTLKTFLSSKLGFLCYKKRSPSVDMQTFQKTQAQEKSVCNRSMEE